MGSFQGLQEDPTQSCQLPLRKSFPGREGNKITQNLSVLKSIIQFGKLELTNTYHYSITYSKLNVITT